MTKCKFVLKVCTVTILFTLLVALEVYAVEPWSNDLWTEPAPTQNGSNKNNQQGSNPGGGLWSDQLWGNTPVQQPTVPPVNAPKPIEKPIIIDKPLPSNNLDAKSYIIVTQVANTKVLVRGVEQEVPVPPTIINGRMMLPLRVFADALNATFSWSNTELKTTILLDSKKIELWNGKATAMINGKAVQLDTPPVILDGSTLVPIRFVSENFGYLIEYDDVSKIIKAAKKEAAVTNPTPTPIPAPTPEEPKPAPEKDQVVTEPKKPVISSNFNYFGEWSMQTDALSGNVHMGTLIVKEDGTYGMKHGISGIAVGTWRQGEKDEVVGQKDMLILENGPGNMDWVMIPKSEGLVGIRYHYNRQYDITNKIWFVDSLGIKVK